MGINVERIKREFATLVSFDSESYGEREIANYLKNKLTELGLEVLEDDAADILEREGVHVKTKESAGNVYGILKGNEGIANRLGLLFSSHMDTVKPGTGKKAVFHEDGRITSEGNTVLGSDDVGGIVSILEMLTVIKEEELAHGDIEVLFPVAEEPYGQGSRVFDYTKIAARQAYVFDLSGKIGTAALRAPTIISFVIEVKGKSAHAGFCPQDGIHAIETAAEALSLLKNGWIDESTTVNFGTISGGTARNIVPDHVTISGEIRSSVHERAVGQMERIRSTFQEIAQRKGAEATVESKVEIPAYHIEEDEAVVKHYVRACSEAGIKPDLIRTFGGSDNNHFTAHGIRGIVVASAMQEVHTTQEYTTVDDLKKSAELALMLATLNY